jgi:heme A synthase
MSVASTTEARGASRDGLRDVARRAFGPSDRTPSRGLRVLTVLTALNTYAVIVMGGVVRTTGSGLGCDAPGDNGWPLCRGQLLPPLDQTAIIEFTHRWLAATMSFLLIALIATAVLRYRHMRSLLVAVGAMTVLLVVQITLGQLTVQYKLPGSIVMVHLANAELLLGAVIVTCLIAFGAALAPAASEAARKARAWMAVAAAGVYGLVLSGAFIVANGAGYACDGWPLCGNGFQLDSGQLAQYNVFHRWVAGAVGILLAVAVVRVVRAYRGRRDVRIAGLAAGVALVAQAVAGAVLVESRLPVWTRSVHEALASALWAAVILVALLVRVKLAATPALATGNAPEVAAAGVMPGMGSAS